MRTAHDRATGWLRPWPGMLVAPAVAVVGLSGCASFWDDVTSRNFTCKSLFVSPDPLVVLRDSQDGNERAKALRSLKEPKRHGGSDHDQDAILKILTTAATSDRQPYCRLAAIDALSRFEDPRAVQALIDAFEAAPQSFTSDIATVIQVQALTALGERRHPSALDLLVRVVREPPAASDVSDQEKQQSLDRRIAAARALGNFSQYQAAQALVHVLRHEKDVALRARAHESLQRATGKKLPPDAKQWEELLQRSPAEPSLVEERNRTWKLLSWF
ncbi:MAG: HEAT repeat domain-containing protein [Gemmataceae bacterium]|nr:HEAT repeat domain-containing protein [Gemmataceae bacterium]MDW8266514.1 HEAT repeat domain-containing protein [Gemmataceae bacterium]